MKYLLRVDLGLSTVALAGGRQGQVEGLPADPHLSLKADPDFGEGTFRFAAPPPLFLSVSNLLHILGDGFVFWGKFSFYGQI